MISEVLVLDHLTLVFLGCDLAEHHGRKHVEEQSCLLHGGQKAEKEREREREGERARDKIHLSDVPSRQSTSSN
jgi:hypothetical protein